MLDILRERAAHLLLRFDAIADSSVLVSVLAMFCLGNGG
jgi:hypothetical protein